MNGNQTQQSMTMMVVAGTSAIMAMVVMSVAASVVMSVRTFIVVDGMMTFDCVMLFDCVMPFNCVMPFGSTVTTMMTPFRVAIRTMKCCDRKHR